MLKFHTVLPSSILGFTTKLWAVGFSLDDVCMMIQNELWKLAVLKFPYGEISVWRILLRRSYLTAKFSYDLLSLWWNFPTAKFPKAKFSTAKLSEVKFPVTGILCVAHDFKTISSNDTLTYCTFSREKCTVILFDILCDENLF